MAARLRRALANEEFQLHYQPIFAADSGALAGVEALLRWHDPERGGLVRPGEFIPVAEETGLIESIGDWVIGAVCEQQVAWAGARARRRRSPSTSRRASCGGSTSSRGCASTSRAPAPTRRGSPSS